MKKFLFIFFIIIIALIVGSIRVASPTQKSVSNTLPTFQSEEEFQRYVDSSPSSYYESRDLPIISEAIESDSAKSVRHSETNVQVMGIDEPDIVKTDGQNIFLSSQQMIWGRPYFYEEQKSSTKIINALPVELKKELDIGGNLLLNNNILIVLATDKVSAYDINQHEILWQKDLKKSEVVTARVYNDKIYLVLGSTINRNKLCPIIPLDGVEIRCQDIHYPINPVTVDRTYHIMAINPSDGEVSSQVSFVGSWNPTIYMSTNNIYVAYEQNELPSVIMSSFVKSSDVFPLTIKQKIKQVADLPISERAKYVEIEEISNNYINSLDEDEAMLIWNKIDNEFNSFLDKNKRDLEKTMVVRIAIDSIEIEKVGFFPGRLLNQFSLDEYDEYLRVATTVGTSNSANDVYVLDQDMRTVGRVVDLGLTERIYSARFIGDKAYLVTFREIDPFYILDLSNPAKPEMTGELKIPGYSSYLHPISDDLILGIGMEDWNVKASLFSVADVRNPKEISKFVLREGWSEAVNNHHAFLMDSKHEIFFLPGSNGGYIFSYADNKLDLVKTINHPGVQRAIYINDYLYVISWDQIVVLDQNNWKEVNRIEI